MKQFSYATRINSFLSRSDIFDWKHRLGDIRDLIERAELVPGLDRIALNYPEHVETSIGVAGLRDRLNDSPLKIEAVNSRFKTEEYLFGALSNPDKEIRRKSIDLCKKAIDVCNELGGDHFILWLSEDGFDYPFQANIRKLWEYTVEGLREIARYGRDIKISIEYKPFDPRRVSLVGNLGATILAMNACKMDNVGVTLDYCHLLMGNEYPAISLVLVDAIEKLYGVHINDGFGLADDGLMPGMVTSMQTLEFIYYLMIHDYDGVIYFDTFPIREDPVAECAANIRWTELVAKKLATIRDEIEAAQENHDAVAIRSILSEFL